MNAPMKKGGGGGSDMILESRHLIGLFLGVVVLCGVFFTLGYVMGRTQYDTTVSAATVPGKAAAPAGRNSAVDPTTSASTTKTPMPAAGDWTFPSTSEAKKPADRLEPAPAPRAMAAAADAATPSSLSKPPAATKPAEKPADAVKPLSSKVRAPLIPRGAIVLQVAALSKQSDALALAEALQHKKFPAFVLDSTGSLYRVQVGPYADAASAEIAKQALTREGFKAIVKK